jgi:thiamine-phosphate pyrophosphorylase
MARRLKPRDALRAKFPGTGVLPPLILMTDIHRLPDAGAAVAMLPKGSAVILRHPDGARRRVQARSLLPFCRACGVLLLIAGDARLAAELGADGIHLPAAMLRSGSRVWRLWRRNWLVTAAAHSPAALHRAWRAGADVALLSPVFTTASHPEANTLGPLRFAAWCRSSPLPVYALGGITALTARRLAHGGAVGFAGIGGLRLRREGGD